jgi:RNA polymerase sigma-70 factor, ECF subfamily
MAATQEDSDEQLMLAFSQGQATAFEWLYQRHRAWLLRWLRSKLAYNQSAADDIAQDTWLSIVRSSASYAPSAKFTTWLLFLAQQRVADLFRKSKVEPTAMAQTLDVDHDEPQLPFEGAEEDTVMNQPDLSFDPAQLVDRIAMREALNAALKQLPVDQRDIFLLTSDAGMSVPEAAQSLGCALEVAKSRLRYARAKLVHAMEAFKP